jgi:hypothetical protein
MINEEFLHYVWRNRAFDHKFLKLTDGTKIDIINPGILNRDAGPDFFNAKIKIGDTLWAGNVEIHIKSSMWYHHNHHKDSAYSNIILHVVAEHDKDVYRNNIESENEKIPVFEMKIPENLFQNYQKLQAALTWIPCSEYFKQMDTITKVQLIDRMAYERLELKTSDIKNVFYETKSNWEETWYRTLISIWGLSLNRIPYQILAKQTPYKILLSHSNNVFELEALLLGQSGLLKIAENDVYVEKLKSEYKHLKNKYSLQPVDAYIWKFARMRPVNFPELRLAQLAALINKHGSMFSKLLLSKSINDYKTFFDINVSEYWLTHYRLGALAKSKTKNIGKSMLELIIINAVAPFMFFYGGEYNDEDTKDFAHNMIKNLNAENNRIMRKWDETGIEAENAFESQALLQLYHFYCNKRKCVSCIWGHKLLNL